VVWNAGRAIVRRDLPDYRLAVAFDHQADNKLALRLEVQNTGTAPLDVDPARLAFRVCRAPTSCSPTYGILDPEKAILALDQARASERASAANAAAFGTVLLLLDTTAAVAATASGKPHEGAALANDGAGVAANTEAHVQHHENNVALIEAEKANWSAVALRHTTVFPGQALAGLIYLPIETTSSRVWLRVNVGAAQGGEVWFPFRQEVIGPPPASARPEEDRNRY
jgi:hypothetical protein